MKYLAITSPITSTLPPTSTFAVVTKPVIALENWMVLDVTFPLFATCSKLDAILVSSEPSPINLSACILPVATSPVVAFVSSMVTPDVFDSFRTSERLNGTDTIETSPSVREFMETLPDMTNTFDPSSSTKRFDPILKS